MGRPPTTSSDRYEALETENVVRRDRPDAPVVRRSVDLLLDAERRAAFARYTELVGRAEGLAVTGLARVVAAARAQALEILFVDPARVVGATVWVGTDSAQMGLTRAELTDPDAAREVPAVAAVIRAATRAGASLVVLDDPDVVPGCDPLDDGSARARPTLLGEDMLTDGLGAVLRFPVP